MSTIEELEKEVQKIGVFEQKIIAVLLLEILKLLQK